MLGIDLPSGSRQPLDEDLACLSGVESLGAAIARALDRADADFEKSVRGALAKAIAEPDLLNAVDLKAKPDCYARNVIHTDPAGRFTILAIVWGPGQFSPVHAHQTWCSYAVHRGTLTESLFSFDSGADAAILTRTEQRATGYHCFGEAGLAQIHKLGNAGDEVAVSIHVYGVCVEAISTGVNLVLRDGEADCM